ncbi:peptide ABC transporter substrate-binding protein [Moraxella sp. ZY200743]|uniref:peptide ABC transporter substrate-binding protein n=1 Tax=Moraxella sp. ZY200743 TaxID=2911970 RepID=UPI003D7D5155
MNLHKKLLGSAVLGTMLVLAGCGGADDKAAVQSTASTGHINIGNGAEPETLDPQKSSDVGSGNIIRQMFMGLTASDADGKTIPSAAESWESADQKVWVFNIKQGLTWSNGEPLTAHDFVYAMQRLTDPKTGAPYGEYLVDAKVKNAKAVSLGKAQVDALGVKALDDHTLQITLDEAVPYLPDLMLLPVTYAVPKSVIEKHGDKWIEPANIVVSGAYKLKEWMVNSHLTLERNTAYHDNANTKIETVSFLPIQGANEINRYKAGELDITAGIPPEQFAKIKSEHPNEVDTTPRLCSFYIEYNMNKPQFSDPKVRQALTMLVNRDTITQQILGRGEISSYQFTPEIINGMKRIDPAWASLDAKGRTEQAMKLLSEAGYSTSKPLQFELLYSTSESAKRLTTAIASMMKQQSDGVVDVSTINQEWKTSLDTRRQGKFDSALAGWCADYNEPSSFYNMLRTNNGNNTGKYQSAAFDQVLDKTLMVANDEERKQLYYEAESILQKDNPGIFLYVSVYNRLVKNNINADSLADPLNGWLVKDWSVK